MIFFKIKIYFFSIYAFNHSGNEINFPANPYTISDKHHLKKYTLKKKD